MSGSKNFSIELEITELGYRELDQLTERMVKIGAATGHGDVVRLLYEAGYHRLKEAVDNVEGQLSGGEQQIILPH